MRQFHFASVVALLLCLTGFSAAQFTWVPETTAFVKPLPVWYEFSVSHPTNLVAANIFMNYTLGAPCTQPVIPPQGCGNCVATAQTNPFGYLCNCSNFDFSSVTATNDACPLSINVYDTQTPSSISNVVGYILFAAPNVTSISMLDGLTYMNLSGSTNATVRIDGTHLASSFDLPVVEFQLMKGSTPCDTVTVESVTVVSRTQVNVNLGPRSQFAASDGCKLSISSFRRSSLGVDGTFNTANSITALVPSQISSLPNTPQRLSDNAAWVEVLIAGNSLPTTADQPQTPYTFSLSGSTACSQAILSSPCTGTATSALCNISISATGTINNCVINVTPSRFNVTLAPVPVGVIADVTVLDPAPTFSLISASNGVWSVPIKTARNVDPGSGAFSVQFRTYRLGTSNPCTTQPFIPAPNATYNGCLSVSFGADSVTCTIPASVLGDGCQIVPVFIRGSHASSEYPVGMLSTASGTVNPSAPNKYFAFTDSTFDIAFVIGQEGVGGSVSALSTLFINFTGTGCAGSASGTLGSVCPGFSSFTRGNSSSSVVCRLNWASNGITAPSDDSVCNIDVTIRTSPRPDFTGTVAKAISRAPEITGPIATANGFVGNGVLLHLTGNALPTSAESYSISFTSSPSGCFSPSATNQAGRCTSGGPLSSRTGFNCMINGTFTTADPCTVSVAVNRFNISSPATTSNVFEVANRLPAAPRATAVVPRPIGVVLSQSFSVTFNVTGISTTEIFNDFRVTYCGTSQDSCQSTNLVDLGNGITQVDCSLSIGSSALDTCSAEISVSRFGFFGPLQAVFIPIIIPIPASTPTNPIPTGLQNFNATFSGTSFPRTGEFFSATVTFACTSATIECETTTIVTSGSSFVCMFDVPALSPPCAVTTTVTRFTFSSNPVSIGTITNDVSLVPSPVLLGLLETQPLPFTVRIAGFLWNTLGSRVVGFTFRLGCIPTGTSTNYTLCNMATSTFDTTGFNCVVESILNTPPLGAGCALRTDIFGSTIRAAQFRLVSRPVLNPATNVIRTDTPSVLVASGTTLPASTAESIRVVPSSASCDVSGVTVGTITQASTTSLTFSLTSPAALDGCPLNITVVRHGFESNSVAFGTYKSNTEVFPETPARGIATGNSSVAIDVRYPPTGSDSVTVSVRYRTPCTFPDPTCTSPAVSGSSIVCNLTVVEQANDCVLEASLSRNGYGPSTFGAIGVATRRPVVTAATRVLPAMVATQVTFSGTLLPTDADSDRAVRLFSTDAGCTSTASCSNPVYTSQSSLTCTITPPVALRNCNVKVAVSRSGVESVPVDAFSVTFTPPSVTAASGTVRAITPTQVTITGQAFPSGSDSGRSVRFFSETSPNCTGTIVCGNPSFGTNSIVCTVSPPLTMRNCTVKAAVSRFGVEGSSADQFTVTEPVFSNFEFAFLFEGDVSPTPQTYINISRGIAEAFGVIDGVIAQPYSKRAVSAVFGATVTCTTYDSVAAATSMQTNQALAAAVIQSVFFSTVAQFSGVPGSLTYSGVRSPVSPLPAPVAELAPQGSAAATGLDAGGIAAIAVVVSIVFIAAVIFVVLVATGRIFGPVPQPPPKQQKSAVAMQAKGGDEEGDSSSSSSSGEEQPAPDAPPASAPAETLAPAETNNASESSGSGSGSSSSDSGSDSESLSEEAV